MIDVLASEPHFVRHVGAVYGALPPGERGLFMALPPATATVEELGFRPSRPTEGPGHALAASIGDLRKLERMGRRVALMEHGAGQSYGGRRTSAQFGSYAGGRLRTAGLFLHPGPHPAARDRAAYPDARVEVVGSPILDTLPAREPGPAPVIAFAFHFVANICPETRPAFAWIRPAMANLVGRWNVLGHGHPRILMRLKPWYSRIGIEPVADFAEVCRRADLLVADNTSVLFAFAATGRPVVVLNPPFYGRDVNHGLRFWDAVGGPDGEGFARIGHPVNRHQDLEPAIERALLDAPEDRERREAALALVYAHRAGGAGRAAEALLEWAAA